MALPERECICGCGEVFTPTHAKHFAKWPKCRARRSRQLREQGGVRARVVSVSKARDGQVSVTVRVPESVAVHDLRDIAIGDRPRIVNDRSEQ